MSENVAFHNSIISVMFFLQKILLDKHFNNICLASLLVGLSFWTVGFFMDSIGEIKGCMYDVVRSVPLMLT